MALGYNHFARGVENTGIYTGRAVDTGMKVLADTAATRKKLQVEDEVEMVNEGIAPLHQLLNRLGRTRTIGGPTFYMWANDELPRWFQANGAQIATSTALVLDSTAGLTNGMQLYDPTTRATIQIDTVTNTTTLVIVAATDAIADDQELMLLGYASPEGSDAPNGIISEPAYHTSTVQTFRRVVNLSRRQIEADLYGGKEMPRAVADAHKAIILDKEATFLFGKVNTTESTYYGTRTKGITQAISTNTVNVASVAMTEDVWRNSFLLPFFRKHNTGDKNLVVMAGETIIKSLDEFGLDRQTTKPSDEVHGVKCIRYFTSFGEIAIINHGLLQVNTELAGTALALDLDQLFEAQYGKSGKLQLRDNIALKSIDGTKSEWLADCGIGVGIEAKHAYMYGAV